MYGKNIGEKRIITVIAVLVMVVAGVVVGFGYGALASTQANNLVKTVPITSDIGMAFGYNGTGKDPTWVAATLTASGTAEELSFPAGFNVTNIVVFEKNPLYDVQGLLNSSFVFSTVNVKTSVLNATGVSEADNYNLQLIEQEFGAQVNDTSTHALSDKAIIPANAYTGITFYSNQINDLNTSEELNVFGLLASSFSDYSGLLIKINGTIASTDHLVVSVTQNFGEPFDINIITLAQTVFIVLGVLILIGVFMGLPRMRGGGR